MIALFSLLTPARAGMLREAMAEARAAAASGRVVQEDISARDHDERLKKALADATRRSCEAPGSVSQAELDALPLPRAGNLVETAWPAGAADCAHVYLYLAANGRDARTLKALSSPTPDASAPAAPTPVWGTPAILFSGTFPKVKALAVAACKAPEQARVDPELTRPRESFLFLPSDDREAARAAAGLGACERKMFQRLIGVIRYGDPGKITGAWLKERAAEYTPAPAPKA
ncbi:MAG: hypothetical protein HYX59_12045 [Elusimicrobia bacterium]|nr:hypothetical protein [Elusimicrobiota bacterium]